MTKLIKAYQRKNFLQRFQQLSAEVTVLRYDDPRYVVYANGCENVNDTLNVSGENISLQDIAVKAAAWLKADGFDVPKDEFYTDTYDRAFAILAARSIECLLCSPRDYNLTAAQIRWFNVRGFAG